MELGGQTMQGDGPVRHVLKLPENTLYSHAKFCSVLRVLLPDTFMLPFSH